MHIGIPVATKQGQPVRVFDRRTLKALSQPDRYRHKVELSPAPLPVVRLSPTAEVPNRAERRRLVQKHVDNYMRDHAANYAHLSARARGRLKNELFAKVMKQAPSDAFARHNVERPRLIVPDIQVEAPGVPHTQPGEKVSPGGIILP